MITSSQELWITMNDEVRLDASVFFPEGEQPATGWPAVVQVHGHGDAGVKQEALAQSFAEQGYVGFCYSVRGQGASEGLSFHLGMREVLDLQDVLTWMTRHLPINSDRMAVVGSSQGGWSAYMAAAHWPRIRTVVAENIFTDFTSFAVPQGCLSFWFFLRTMRRFVMTAGFPDIARRWAISGEWNLIEEWVRPRSPILFADRITCPVLITHGWADAGMPPNEAIAMFDRLKGPKKLILGEGGHEGIGDDEGKKIKAEAIDRWLAHWLKDEETGVLDEPDVTYGRLPDWSYHRSTSFPPPEAKEKELFLFPDLALRESAPDRAGRHSNVANVILRPDYDLKAAVHDDMNEVESAIRRTEVTFRWDVGDSDFEIAGAPQFRLHMLADHPAFQVHAELYDRSPRGDERLISRGHYGTRCAEPGRHTLVEIEGRAINYVVKAGHALELVVTNCNPRYAFPYFEPFRARLFHEHARPSAVVLPVLSRTPKES